MLASCKRDFVEKLFEELNDPLIIDIREFKDIELAKKYARDYRWLEEFVNKGITEIILRNKYSGKMRLNGILSRVEKFGRDIILLYEDKNHCDVVWEIINEERKSFIPS
jgi:hypothetical protein